MVSFEDIREAAGLIATRVLRTPLLPSPRLSAICGAEIFVKYENMQATGSFKERGALVRLLRLSEAQRARGVCAMSAGNHAQAVAYHAARLGVAATIVMPASTPVVKVENTRSHGAKVILKGDTLGEAETRCLALQRAQKLALIHPYDDVDVIAGQGTVGLEIFEELADLDALVVPIGGGGLISGVAIAAHQMSPATEIVGVEAALYPSFRNALGGQAPPIGGATLAEGIAVKKVGTLTLPIVRDLVDHIALVSETDLERAVSCFATCLRTMAEGAGAAALAAVLADPEHFRGRRVALVLSGGNIDPRMLAAVMMRDLEREDRIVSFRVTLSDRPGLLGLIATRLGEAGANILEVSHRRLLLDVPAKGVGVDVTMETRDRAHAEAVLAALARDGLAPRRIGPGGHDPIGD
ncbi:MAG TPA: threonine ammonia-lyase [Beijerinckiaceae bacterium]|nr:threonine ammonia-lyase [Beijerinckiaceae bacterium]